MIISSLLIMRLTLSVSLFKIIIITKMKDILFYLPVIIAPILVTLISVYLLAFYSHPDDNKSAYFAKFCIVSSLVISHIIVLIIPLDVSSEMNTLDVWTSVFIIAMTLIFVFIPISILFYE